MRILISDDALAIACGADAVAEAFAHVAPDAEIVRVSSWGMHWLEPLVEIDGVGYGPVTVADVPLILPELARGEGPAKPVEGLARASEKPLHQPSAGPPPRSGEDLCIGPIADHPFIARQTRLTFARAGRTRPLSLEDYEATGGWKGLRAAQAMTPAQIVEAVTASGLRGRGGAGFPAGIKWKTVLDAPGTRKYIVCNADEGDSGTFADRMLMEGDPYCLIEGMAIAGLATGATRGFIYIRSEYPHAIRKMEAAIERAQAIVAPFDIEVRIGAGAYVCGEETSLLNSIEGKRGEVRAKPPLPAHKGLFGCPTAINNVLTLAAVSFVLAEGAEAYANYGMGRSRGTMPIQLAGNIRHGGLFETAFGVTLGELVDEIGGGAASGRPVRAAQVGGPLGAYFPPALFDTPFDYEAFAARDGLIGHGGVVVFDESVDMAVQAKFAMEFCAIESCGKCTPCRLGSTRGMETIARIIRSRAPAKAGAQEAPAPQPATLDPGLRRGTIEAVTLIEDLCETMKSGSLCALGGFTPYPVLSALHHFPEDFGIEEPAA